MVFSHLKVISNWTRKKVVFVFKKKFSSFMVKYLRNIKNFQTFKMGFRLILPKGAKVMIFTTLCDSTFRGSRTLLEAVPQAKIPCTSTKYLQIHPHRDQLSLFTPRQKAKGVLLWAVPLPPSVNFSVFSHYRSHFLGESSRFLVCELLVGGGRGR